MAQGKAWDKDKVITEVLKPYFLLGYNVRMACILGNIPQQTVDTWIQKDKELRLKIESWQNYPNAKAREVHVKSFAEKGDVKSAQWELEHKDKEYKPKQDVTSDDKPVSAGIFMDMPPKEE